MNTTSPIKSVVISRDNNVLSSFGTITITMKDDLPPSHKHHHFVFTIDCSGSMHDFQFKSTTSKYQLIKQAMIQLFRQFSSLVDISISATIITFDAAPKIMLNNYTITHTIDDYEVICEIFDKINPDDNGMTNIESALMQANVCMDERHTQHPHDDITHIFLTDGEISEGCSDKRYLATLVNSDFRNIFVGYGKTHDAILLNLLASAKRAQYYFVDKCENSGMIYGEIIHNVLYCAIPDVELRINSGKYFKIDATIYDYKQNRWSDALFIGDLVSGASKTFHIKSNDFRTLSILITSITDKDIVHWTVDGKYARYSDLDPFKFRQRAQELMHQTHTRDMTTGRSHATLFSQLVEFLKELEKYISDNELNNDPFMKVIYDDIYVIITTFKGRESMMFSISRSESQGQQRVYNATNIDESQLKYMPPLPPLAPMTANQLKRRKVEPEIDFNAEFKLPTLTMTFQRQKSLSDMMARCSI